ncbi:hypothetical protein Droror1_Dr00018567 [Drosera rotundifolia]
MLNNLLDGHHWSMSSLVLLVWFMEQVSRGYCTMSWTRSIVVLCFGSETAFLFAGAFSQTVLFNLEAIAAVFRFFRHVTAHGSPSLLLCFFASSSDCRCIIFFFFVGLNLSCTCNFSSPTNVLFRCFRGVVEHSS